MRIVHISDCFAPRTGGIETQVGDLAATQAAAGDDVHVFTATPGRVQGWVENWRGVRIHRMDARLLGVPINPLAPPRMTRTLQELAPDVVHVHAGVVSPFAYDGARVVRQLGLPLVVTWHCMLDGWTSLLRQGVRKLGWHQTPMVLSAVSRVAADRVQAVFEKDVFVLPNAIDVAAWAPTAPKAPQQPLAVVATMRLAPRKRGVALIEVFREAVAATGPEAMRLTVIGVGPDGVRMVAAARRAGIADLVRFTGRLSHDVVRAVYAQQHVFMAPAKLEAFGIAALEARAAGLVVIGRTGNGLAEFVTDGVDGFLADDDEGMVRALVRLTSAAGEPSPELRAMLAHTSSVQPELDWAHAYETARALYKRARAAEGS